MKRKLLFILIAAASCLFTACTEKNKPSNNEGERKILQQAKNVESIYTGHMTQLLSP